MNYFFIFALLFIVLWSIFKITKEKQWKMVLLYLMYWTWCFPQSFIGLIWFIVCKIRGFKSSEYNKYTLWTHDTNYSPAGGVSLGMFMFSKEYDMNRYVYNTEIVRDHEYGHVIQSLMLGWFYIIIIGLPSVVWLLLHSKTRKSYYWFYTESWADKLGKVKRIK
jgi:hypothetical protein